MPRIIVAEFISFRIARRHDLLCTEVFLVAPLTPAGYSNSGLIVCKLCILNLIEKIEKRDFFAAVHEVRLYGYYLLHSLGNASQLISLAISQAVTFIVISGNNVPIWLVSKSLKGSPMILKGSCHCGGVQFQLTSKHPYPFNYCYCSICRKTQGAGGFAINLSGDADSLEIVGEENITIYQAKVPGAETGDMEDSPARRHFCKICSSNLWVFDPRWPELLHPFASAIDTELPIPPERTHLMLGSKASWVAVMTEPKDKEFEAYPEESVAQWHQRLGLEC